MKIALDIAISTDWFKPQFRTRSNAFADGSNNNVGTNGEDRLTTDVARAAYQFLLDRLPENEEVIAELCRVNSIKRVRESIVNSEEFRVVNRPYIQGGLQNHGGYPPDTWAIVEIQHGLRLWVDFGDQGIVPEMLAGSYETSETNFIMRQLQPGMHFVDIGANLGWFTVQAARLVGHAGFVTAFEPQPMVNHYLVRSVVENGFTPITAVHGTALSDAAGEFLISNDVEARNLGGAWLLTTSDLQAAKADLSNSVVDTIRLDDAKLTRKPDIIKIDVEGCEYRVFQGAPLLLDSSRPMIISEINRAPLSLVSGVTPIDYINYMTTFRYKCYLIEDGMIRSELSDTGLMLDGLISVAFVPIELTGSVR